MPWEHSYPQEIRQFCQEIIYIELVTILGVSLSQIEVHQHEYIFFPSHETTGEVLNSNDF